MSIFAPRSCASTARRLALVRIGPVLRRDFLFSARPAAELCPGLGRLAVRPAVAALAAAHFASQPVQRALSTDVDIRPVHRPRPFPSFRNGPDPSADPKPLPYLPVC